MPDNVVTYDNLNEADRAKYDDLNQSYSKIICTQTDNGVGFVAYNTLYDGIVVPPNVEESTSLGILMPGIGSTGSGANTFLGKAGDESGKIISQALEGQYPDSAVVIAGRYNSNSEFITNAYNTLGSWGANISDVSATLFSGSGGFGTKDLAEFLGDKQQTIDGVNIVYLESGNMNVVKQSDIDVLKEFDTKCIYINGSMRYLDIDHADKTREVYKQMMDSGIDMYYMESDIGHDTLPTRYLKSNGLGFMLDGDNLTSSSFGLVQIRTYDENGKAVNIDANDQYYSYFYRDNSYAQIKNLPYFVTEEVEIKNGIVSLSNNQTVPISVKYSSSIEGINAIRKLLYSNYETGKSNKSSKFLSTSSFPQSVSSSNKLFQNTSSILISDLALLTDNMGKILQNYTYLEYYLQKDLSTLGEEELVKRPSDIILGNAGEITKEKMYERLGIEVNIKPGKIGTVNASDIVGLLKGDTLGGSLGSQLASEKENSRMLISQIDAFIASNSLTGPGSTTLLSELSNYKEYLTKRIKSAEYLEQEYVRALKVVKEYLGDDEYIDDSDLNELEIRLSGMKRMIHELRSMLRNIPEYVTYKDEKGEFVTCYNSRYSEVSGRISSLEKDIAELEPIVTKKKNLSTVINKANEIIVDANLVVESDYTGEVLAIRNYEVLDYEDYVLS